MQPRKDMASQAHSQTTASSSTSDRKRKRTPNIIVGTSSFDKIIRKNAAVIDKTMFIKDWMEAPVVVSAVMRPSRFGKSTNLSMLKSFFSLNAQCKNFERFLIGKETEFIEEHCGQYPVVYMDMKCIRGDNWEQMLSDIWVHLREIMRDQRHHLDEEDVQYIGVNYLDANAPANEGIAGCFLKFLTSCLYERHSKRVIVLIDEYDAPLNHACREGDEFYEKASDFFGSFYSNGLKGNPALKKACLMGIVEIGGYRMLSRLNNLVINSSGDERYSEYFGFTREEVSKFLDGDEKRIKDVMALYNGHYMGSHQMINPWSFANYISRGELKSYWVRASSFDSIRSIISPALNIELVEILGKLYDGQEHEIGELYTTVNYMKTATTTSMLAFLTHTGYLTYKDGKVSIPNQEIKYAWGDHALGLTGTETVVPAFRQPIMDILGADQVNIRLLENRMRAIFSYHDLRSENSYHVFYLAVFIVICGPSKVSSNKESGHRGYDIVIRLDELKRLFVFELKLSQKKGDFEKDATEGLRQIQEKKYYQDQQFSGWTCFLIGVAFYKKCMSNLVCEELIL